MPQAGLTEGISRRPRPHRDAVVVEIPGIDVWVPVRVVAVTIPLVDGAVVVWKIVEAGKRDCEVAMYDGV